MDHSNSRLSRRTLIGGAIATVAAALMPADALGVWTAIDPDRRRLRDWTTTLRAEGLSHPSSIGRAATRVGELAVGTPYKPYTLDAYLRAGGSPLKTEPLTLSLSRFDCLTLVESCLAVARIGEAKVEPTWEEFGREIERMRYRGGERRGYTSRLHYFSEWMTDGEKRGLCRDRGRELGGVEDVRPLRFMTEHRASYPALSNDQVFREIASIEHRLDGRVRHIVPTDRIARVADQIESGDVLGFATEIPGLDVTHTAFAYRGADRILRVLHAPLSGGVVEVSRTTLPEYVAAIRRATGILVARPLRG